MGLGLIGLKESLEEFKTPNFWRDCMVDFLATFTLFFVVLLFMAEADIKPLSVGLIVGMTIFSNIEAFGHVQWAVMHPVVAVNFMFTKRISFLKCFFYIGFDLGACVCVAYCMKIILPETTISAMGPPRPGPNISSFHAMLTEWIIVTFHHTAILGSMDAEKKNVFFPPLTIGLATFVGVSAAIYWTGDFLGGLTALLLYHFSLYNKGIFRKNISQDEKEKGEAQEVQDAFLMESNHVKKENCYPENNNASRLNKNPAT